MRPLRSLWHSHSGLCSAAVAFILIATSCKMPSEKPDFSNLTEDFVYGSLALSPTSATSAGYHEHQGVRLDEQLDDFSASGIENQRRFYSGFRDRLAKIQRDALSMEESADYEILQHQVELALLEIDRIQSYRHNPTVYVELVGNSLFTPFVLEYAPLEMRYRHIIQRLSKVPALLEQARMNLMDAPEVWNRVAREENDGNVGLIDMTLRAKAPESLKSDYDHAAAPAVGGAA